MALKTFSAFGQEYLRVQVDPQTKLPTLTLGLPPKRAVYPPRSELTLYTNNLLRFPRPGQAQSWWLTKALDTWVMDSVAENKLAIKVVGTRSFYGTRRGIMAQAYALVRFLRTELDQETLAVLRVAGLYRLSDYTLLVLRPRLLPWAERHPWVLRWALRTGWFERSDDPPTLQDMAGPGNLPGTFTSLLRVFLRTARWSWHFGAQTRGDGVPRLERLCGLPTSWRPNTPAEWRLLGRSIMPAAGSLFALPSPQRELLVRTLAPWFLFGDGWTHRFEHAADLLRQGAGPRDLRSEAAMNAYLRQRWEARYTPQPARQFERPAYAIADTPHITWLPTSTALAEEGREMRHCVGGYAAEAQRQECALYRVETPQGGRYTVEQSPNGTLRQVRGKCNRLPDANDMRWINEQFSLNEAAPLHG